MRSLIVLVCLVGVAASIAMMPQKNAVKPKELGAFCSVCEAIIKDLEDEYTDDEAALKAKAEALCDKYAPNILQSVCKQFVDEALDDIKDLIANKEQPNVVCQKIDLC